MYPKVRRFFLLQILILRAFKSPLPSDFKTVEKYCKLTEQEKQKLNKLKKARLNFLENSHTCMFLFALFLRRSRLFFEKEKYFSHFLHSRVYILAILLKCGQVVRLHW